MCDIELEQLDVKISFLHGVLEERIYMKQHEGFVRKVRKIRRVFSRSTFYRLKQSPKQWYKRFDSFMIKANYTRCEYDSCIYFK